MYLLRNLHPLNFKDQTPTAQLPHGSTHVPNFIAIALRGACPQIFEI